ncbi:MAG: hypothetical protein JSS62_06965 [Verrucomicrobia bacterium]|nr:hypothetical protein [Verrucomicrobiota bacterium]
MSAVVGAKPNTSFVVDSVRACDQWGMLALPGTLVGLAGQVSQVFNILAPQIPWAGIAVAPISFHGVVLKVRSRWANAYHAPKISDKIFWGMQGIASVGKAVSRSIQPLMGSLGLAGFQTTGTAAFIFQKVLPPVMLATSGIGLLASVWALGKKNQDYRRCKLPEDPSQIREFYNQHKQEGYFRRLYSLHNKSLDILSDQQLLNELKKGLYFNNINHIRNIVGTILGLVASVLFIAAPQCRVVSGSLLIASSGLELLFLAIKNSLMYKSQRMIRSSVCAQKPL